MLGAVLTFGPPLVLASAPAAASTVGEASTAATWTVPVDESADWLPGVAPVVPPGVAEASADVVPVPPLVATSTGAETVASGATVADPTWTVPVEPVAVWPGSASAVPVGIVIASAAARTRSRRFTWCSFRCAVSVEAW
jgi:hypothetical protein